MKRIVGRVIGLGDTHKQSLRERFVQRLPAVASPAAKTFRSDVMPAYSAWMECVADDTSGESAKTLAARYSAARDAWLARFNRDAQWVWVGDLACNMWGNFVVLGPRSWPAPPTFTGREGKAEQQARLRAYNEAVERAKRRRDGERRGRKAGDPGRVFDWLIAARFAGLSWREMEQRFPGETRNDMHHPMQRLESRLL